ncbi:uncharacterized protein BYT42DRAFT_609772 [Radiomyces spectabilis]|uniref:uncharacterized protein n=1 Tax=Radiomyces spectabilis TaxID=64574 RepID=UPI0022202088|nr:uncharacterized protein BYT42DRAFT_609772 [Radiomyces spectabilis]KAI8394012.1 hypothetical protein BYT42DRAFT_609772 [Radiomyces spectabilis]
MPRLNVSKIHLATINQKKSLIKLSHTDNQAGCLIVEAAPKSFQTVDQVLTKLKRDSIAKMENRKCTGLHAASSPVCSPVVAPAPIAASVPTSFSVSAPTFAPSSPVAAFAPTSFPVSLSFPAVSAPVPAGAFFGEQATYDEQQQQRFFEEEYIDDPMDVHR